MNNVNITAQAESYQRSDIHRRKLWLFITAIVLFIVGGYFAEQQVGPMKIMLFLFLIPLARIMQLNRAVTSLTVLPQGIAWNDDIVAGWHIFLRTGFVAWQDIEQIEVQHEKNGDTLRILFISEGLQPRIPINHSTAMIPREGKRRSEIVLNLYLLSTDTKQVAEKIWQYWQA